MPAIVTFDTSGPYRIVENSVGGDNELSWLEVYSEWKVWSALSDNLKYPPAFRILGGDATGPTEALGATFFMQPPWKFKPAELHHRLTMVGNLYYEGGVENPVVPTDGTWTVLVEAKVSNLTSVLYAQTASAVEIADAVLDEVLSEHTTAGTLGAELTRIRQRLHNRMRVNIITQELELWNDANTAILWRWPLYTKGGEPVTTSSGVQVDRGPPQAGP